MKTFFKKKLTGKVFCFECEYFYEWSSTFGNCIHSTNLIGNKDLKQSRELFTEKNKYNKCRHFKKCDREILMDGRKVKDVVKLLLK